METIDIYPKFAKYALIVLFALAACAALILLANCFVVLSRTVLLQAVLVLVVFLPPLLSAAEDHFDQLEREADRIGFIDNEALQQHLEPLLKRHVDHPVRVGYYLGETRYAFCISNIFGSRSFIAFSSAFCERATVKELLALGAHEIAHLKNGDSVGKSYMLALNKILRFHPDQMSERLGENAFSIFTLTIGAIVLVGWIFISLIPGASVAAWPLLWTGLKIGVLPAVGIFGLLGLNFILKRAFYAHSRETEYRADLDGAAMTSADDLRSALCLLTNPEASASVFDTHPPLAKRLKRLVALTNG